METGQLENTPQAWEWNIKGHSPSLQFGVGQEQEMLHFVLDASQQALVIFYLFPALSVINV